MLSAGIVASLSGATPKANTNTTVTTMFSKDVSINDFNIWGY